MQNNPYQQQPNPYGPGAAPGGAPSTGAFGGAPGGAPRAGYEFTGEQNEIIRRAGNGMMAFGVFQLVVAFFNLLSLNVFAVATAGVVGLFGVQAGSAFKQVTESTGNDVAHLMEALDKVSRLVMARLIILAIWVGGLTLGAAFLAAMLVSGEF